MDKNANSYKTTEKWSEGRIKRLKKQASEVNKPLFDPSNTVIVVTEDGSFFMFRSAFFEHHEVEEDWYLVVFPEHGEISIFSAEDLIFFNQFPWLPLRSRGEDFLEEV